MSPRPNFLVLLGDRYGSWLPPTRLPAGEFEALYQNAPTDAQQMFDAWYQPDLNAVQAEYCLLPRTGAYIDDDTWGSVVRALQAVFLEGTGRLQAGSYDPVPYRASITEQEILAGVFDLPGTSDHACCLFRRISTLDEVVRAPSHDPAARRYVDVDATNEFDFWQAKTEIGLKPRTRNLPQRFCARGNACWLR